MSHRGSGRGPNTVEHASHLDAADMAKVFALRRDRLVVRQRVPYQYSAKRQVEIDLLAKAYDLFRSYADQRHVPLDE